MFKFNLKKLRISKSRNGRAMTQARLAQKLGVTRSYVSRLEKGSLQPSAETMFKIAEEFDQSVDAIFQYVSTKLKIN